MKHSQPNLADLLGETNRALIADTMARNRARFGGWKMELDAGDGNDSAPDSDTGTTPDTEKDAATTGTDDNGKPQEGKTDVDTDADDGRIKKANSEAARYRTERNGLRDEVETMKTTLDALAKVLNPDASADEAPTADDLASQITAKDTEIAGLTAQVTVLRTAAEHNADATKLLDRVSFVTALNGLDSSSESYADDVAALIKKTVETDSSLATKAPAGNGGIPTPGGGSTPVITQAEFDRMNATERSRLFKADPATYRSLAGR